MGIVDPRKTHKTHASERMKAKWLGVNKHFQEQHLVPALERWRNMADGAPEGTAGRDTGAPSYVTSRRPLNKCRPAVG